MRLKNVILTALFAMCLQGTIGMATSVKTISDYAKVATNVGRNVKEIENRSLAIEKVSEKPGETNGIDYEDFDDLQEQTKSLNQQSASNEFIKYFSGLISLFALFYRFKEKENANPLSKSIFPVTTEPRNSDSRETPKSYRKIGNVFEEAQDRFDFPQKKFKKAENAPFTGMKTDQQLQPLENYPPYNPLTANLAESYGNNDKKTSYDAYVGQISFLDNPRDKENQQSYGSSYEANQPIRQNSNNHVADYGSSWNVDNNNPPIYHSWMSKPQTDEQTSNLNSYHTINSYQSWQDIKTANGDYKSNQPWMGNPSLDYPIYNHDIKYQHSDDHHQDHPEPYHEVEHQPVDEDRVSKKPYSYYFLGRKLWYVPLLFSVYFIMYVGALVLKSVARHKIQFPEKVWDLHDEAYGHGKGRNFEKIDEITKNYEKAVDKVKNKFM